MPTSTPQDNASYRMVVLLRPSERKRLQKLARKADVSSSEIIRRSLNAYSPQEPELTAEEEHAFRLALAEMNTSLDQALKSVRSARLEIAQNLADIRKLRASHEEKQ